MIIQLYTICVLDGLFFYSGSSIMICIYLQLEMENKDLQCPEEEEDLSSKGLKEVPNVDERVVNLFLDFNDIRELPEGIGCLKSLKYFSIIGNSLQNIPQSFCDLQTLEELHLNENDLCTLPNSICRLKTLKVLKLTGNKLQQLPDEFGELSSLKVLHCDENNLCKLPKTFGLLEELIELELGANSIETLIDGFGMLKSLQVLNLSNNQLTALPESFGNLSNLVTLDVSANKLKHLPSHFNSCYCVEKLYFESNLLYSLPDWISDLTNVVEFSFKDNQFQGQAISDQFPHNCQKLKHFDMSGNFMNKLPEDLGAMRNVKFIHLGSVIGELERRNFQNGNWLATIPDSICQLTLLRELYMDENQISQLPNSFGELVSLEILDLGMYNIELMH